MERKPPQISRKESQLGNLFTTFQMDRLVSGVSPKTLELYENAWKFYGPELDKIRVNFRSVKGNTRLKGDALKLEERVIVDNIKITIAKAKLGGRKISGLSINIYSRQMNGRARSKRDKGQSKPVSRHRHKAREVGAII
jgi:hypothetical protein